MFIVLRTFGFTVNLKLFCLYVDVWFGVRLRPSGTTSSHVTRLRHSSV